MRRIVVLSLLLLPLIPLTARPAWACSCARLSIQEEAKVADAVFLGVAGPTEGNHTTFRPLIVYKGHVSDGTIAHETNEASCGLTFEEGKTYTVFANTVGGELETTNLCIRTQKGVVPPTELRLTGHPFVPDAGSAPPTPASSSGESFFSGPLFWILFRFAAALAVPVYLLIRTRIRNRRKA